MEYPAVSSDRPVQIQKRKHLLKFHRLYQAAKQLAIAMTLLLLWWGATMGPMGDVIFQSIGALLGFVLVVISVPVFFFIVFPPPFSGRLDGETAGEALDRERVKLVLLVVISMAIFAQIFFLADEGINWGPPWMGYACLGGTALFAGWVLRRRQKEVLLACWKVLKGREK